MAQINRMGKVRFGEASFSIWEDGLSGDSNKRRDWESEFYKQVFKRIVQMLRKIGWSVERNQEDYERTIAQYGLKFANKYCWRARDCSYGDLKGHLNISGRSINFEMWQGINTPTRSDHGGRYESDKELIMPFVLRMKMERTRRKLRDYLCGVFSGYEFDDCSTKATRVGLGGITALQSILEGMKSSGHYKPELGRAQYNNPSNEFTGDGAKIEHGVSKVYGFDWKGNPFCGVAYYDLNGNYYVHCGKYNRKCNIYHNTLSSIPPGNLRDRNNHKLRRQRLEGEMQAAIAKMDFLRADIIKNLLFKPYEELFIIKCDDGLYERTSRCGYTRNLSEAGKFTWDQVCKISQNDRKVIKIKDAA